VKDEIWANIWQTECIARIDPQSGVVKGWLLMHGLRHSLHHRRQRLAKGHVDVLNGEGGGLQAGAVPGRRQLAGCTAPAGRQPPAPACWGGPLPDSTPRMPAPSSGVAVLMRVQALPTTRPKIAYL
jgi:hypothetical protein